MMALNIAVPLTTVGDLMDGFGLLSPISPLNVDCRAVATPGSHGKKQLVSPVGSESSGVSSLDSDEIKKPSSPPATPTEEVERPVASSPLLPSSTTESDTVIATPETIGNKSSSCSSTRSSRSSTDSISSDCNSSEESSQVEDLPELETDIPKEIKVVIGGRNVLNLMDNLISPGQFRLQFAQLPENDNIHFFLDNRSQYHRLGANGHIQEYTMVKCKCCDFRYPVNGPSPMSGGVTAPIGQTNWATAVQQQHQTQLHQQQQSFQWNSFNNYDSISSRNKLGLTVAASAFNKFGSSNNNNNGNQYFRSNMGTSLFGRDSNHSNSGGSFLNNSTNTYNNHKSYQQSFGTSNNNSNSKFNTAYGTYKFQQQLLSKNQHMRFGNGNANGSSGFNASAAIAAASAMAGQNILNFNGNFNGKNNNNNNNNNMFAYYKAMMN